MCMFTGMEWVPTPLEGGGRVCPSLLLEFVAQRSSWALHHFRKGTAVVPCLFFHLLLARNLWTSFSDEDLAEVIHVFVTSQAEILQSILGANVPKSPEHLAGVYKAVTYFPRGFNQHGLDFFRYLWALHLCDGFAASCRCIVSLKIRSWEHTELMSVTLLWLPNLFQMLF